MNQIKTFLLLEFVFRVDFLRKERAFEKFFHSHEIDHGFKAYIDHSCAVIVYIMRWAG